MRPLPKNGVGTVISLFLPSRHSSEPVLTSYPRANLVALVTTSVRSGPTITVGVPHEGTSSRGVFQIGLPSASEYAARNEFFPASHWTINRSSKMTGDDPNPHW